ncbi:TIGR00375 family protein [Alicyclobacillus sp. ALC3]|nr:TIGR00375 family protein [Alicyclobacillus sp. ALC3]
MGDFKGGPLYADFHIHIGRSLGQPVKMAAAPSLTLDAVLRHARTAKGLDIITVIDGVCTNVLTEVRQLMEQGLLSQLSGGGLRHENGLTVLLGAEVEVEGPGHGAAHFGAWFGDMLAAAEFADWLGTVQKNPALSSQRARVAAQELQHTVKQHAGLFIVHHAFTPHKGLYGSCVTHMADMVNPDLVDALELGLSADTDMADCVSELAKVSFITNSDAHSLPKIAREYNALKLQNASFEDVTLALARQSGRSVSANYGLIPALGKYHRTRCADCGAPWPEQAEVCVCGSRRHTVGVFDRLREVQDRDTPVHPMHRPRYVAQVPLEFVPGVGPTAIKHLLAAFGTEMNVLHRTSVEDIASVVGPRLASAIDAARTGQMSIVSGGGGVYGSVRLQS